MAGTIFQDSKLPLTIWFWAMWQVTSRKNGISALGLQRVPGLGSYKNAWTFLHKLRRAMVRPVRERLHGAVEVEAEQPGGDVVFHKSAARAPIRQPPAARGLERLRQSLERFPQRKIRP